MTEDERLARRLQEEENARARNSPRTSADKERGAASSYYAQQQGPQPGYGYGQQGQSQSQNPYVEPKAQHAKGGFLGKLLGKASGSRPHGGGYPQPQPYVQPGYGPQSMYAQPGRRKPGMGVGGAAALGAGGGLLGGMMLGGAMGDHGGDGGDYGGDGGDFGGDGGDFGGGDFGGDGCDFGGDF